MPPQTDSPKLKDSTVDAFLAIPADKQRLALSQMSPEAKQALYTAMQARKASAPGPLTTIPTDPAHPYLSALAQEGLTDLNEAEARTSFAGKHPYLSTAGDILSMGPGLVGSAPELSLEALIQSLKRAAIGGAKGAGLGAASGGGIGYALGGPEGAKTGARLGGFGGLFGGGLHDFFTLPPTLEQQADELVAKQMAVKASRVRAGIDPPAEDTIAEVLRQDLLGPQKKSGVPQTISSPKAISPTYVPEGVPGAKAAAEPPKTIGQIANERIAQAARRAGDKSLQRTADIEAGLISPPEPPKPQPPAFSKLSEGPTALQHQAARARALEDIRNATINRPGWVSKLPDKATFKKLPTDVQRAFITHAINSDEEASQAIRANARIGSAGDLASWTPEQLWTRYLKDFQNPNADKRFLQSIGNELARRGQVTTAPFQVRP